MKNRLEYKYLVPVEQTSRLRTDLLRYLTPDEYAAARPGHEYTVRSIYMDSPDFKCYYEKLDGIQKRKKFRIRGYNTSSDNSAIFFEIKHKYENFISKTRARTSYGKLQQVLADRHNGEQCSADERQYFNTFFYHYEMKRLEPKALIVYDREAFECKFGSQLRITFDKNLRSKTSSHTSQLFEDDGLQLLYPKEFVLEVKFFQVLPMWIKTVLEKYDLTRLAVSKYTSAIDAQSSASVRSNTFNRSIDN